MRWAYYNENNSHAAEWLFRLMRAGFIPAGVVDTRSITEVQPEDVRSFVQCHFFAGIGGWPHALRLAGWPDDRPIWTGSCPCQPFSVAGKNKGAADERHLWPDLYRLVRERRPPVLMGEQVARKAGKAWFAGVRADLEDGGYAARGVVVPACSVGAPHERERLFFVADTNSQRRSTDRVQLRSRGQKQATTKATRSGARSLGNAGRKGSTLGQEQHAWQERAAAERAGGPFWGGSVWLECADGKQRRVGPGIPLLADGPAARVAGALSGLGNAIVAPLATEVIAAYLDAERAK